MCIMHNLNNKMLQYQLHDGIETIVEEEKFIFKLINLFLKLVFLKLNNLSRPFYFKIIMIWYFICA